MEFLNQNKQRKSTNRPLIQRTNCWLSEGRGMGEMSKMSEGK